MNGGQQQKTQHQQEPEAHQSPRAQNEPKTATATHDEDSTGGGAAVSGGVDLTTGGSGATPTVKMQQARQEAPAVTPATVTAAAAPSMTTASAAATAVAAAAAATAAASATASGANGSGGNNNGNGNNSPTTAAQTVAAINKKRKKEGLKPIITTDNPATGYVYAFLDSLEFSAVCVAGLLHDIIMFSPFLASFPEQVNPVLPGSESGSGLCVAAHSVLCCAVFRSMGSELSTGRILVQDRRSVSRSVSHASQPDGSRLGAHGWRKQGECAQIIACTAGQGKVLARSSLRPREKSREDGRLVGSEPNIPMDPDLRLWRQCLPGLVTDCSRHWWEWEAVWRFMLVGRCVSRVLGPDFLPSLVSGVDEPVVLTD